MALQQVNRRGQWIEERMLGSGGFGAVHLWRNEETDEKLALKRCRLQNEMTDKHRQRWQLEVQIMGRLEHENVIAALDVPGPLDVHKHELPLLAMEYCSGGDLRKILNRPQSCCGLREFAIRCLVKDIASAVEYLHGNKIIHRDLKPENIVLKPVDEKIVYKIIDLGYAKELDQGSVCTSFVGTLQYLAPELFASQMYTCTVDYWSFGTVLFECITGYRPFLPTIPPFKWHQEVKQKTNDDICAMFDSRGEIKFYKVIPTTNNLSRSMQTYLEQWLRLMLRWDPKARGGGLAKDKRPACFTMLDNILAMKIIYVFHVADNELLTFPVVDQHTMLDLHRRIEEETHIPVNEQDIILGTGVTPEHDKPAAMCWLEPCEDDTLVYLFRKGGKDFGDNSPKKYKAIPPAVQTIVKDPSIIIPFEEQKKAWAESVHFCEEQFRDFRRMILSQRAAMLSLLRNDSIFVKTKNTMINDMDQLLAKIQYFKASLNHDVMFYKQLEKEQGMGADSMFSKWKKMDEDVDSFKNMKVKVSELEQKASVVQTKIVELQRSPFARSKQDDTLDKFSKEARDAYSEFRASVRDNKEALRDQKPMVTIIVKCILHRDKKLADLFAHLSKICSCKKDIDELLPQIEKCVQDINTNSEKLISYQKQRQTSVWRLLEVALHQNKQSQVQTPNRAALHVDTTLVCRQESKASNGNGNGTATIFQSSPNLESLKVMEDSKTTNKKFEETLSSLIQEQEEFASLISEIVYKIIDLGYAKELDQGSVCTSFVGTLQYLAPELFASQMYTCTVDYWSFGTVLFECITGYRPFLPTIPPFKWHQEVKQKTNDDICAMFDSRGEIKFYKVIPTTNNLSRSMQTYLEQWLRLMLRWDPKARGGGLAKDKRPACFTMLDNILAMKIIYVFHVADNELLTFPVVDQHTMLDLHRRIEEETHIPVNEQDIILGTGVTPEHDKPAAMCWLEPCEDDTLVYLFRKGGKDFGDNSPKKYKAIPPAVQTIVKDPSIIIPFEEQKKAWAESVHFCEEQFRDFRRMILSQRAAMLSLLRNDSIFVKTKNTMINDMDQLLAKIQYFKASLNHDVMFYKQLEKEQGMGADSMFSKWKKMDEDVDSFKNMKVKVSELEQKASVVQTKIVELQRSPFARSKQDDTLDKFSKEARDAYSEFRASARDNKEALRDQKPMVTIIVKCILHRDKKLADLFAHLSKICSCKKDIDELLPQIEKCVQDINTNSEKLISYQKQRQTSVWRLLEVALHQNKQSQVQTPNRTALHVDTTLVCRQESKASNGSGNGTATIFQSSPNLESLKVVEDSKTTNKKFEETLSSLIQEHEEFASLISEV